MRRHLPLGRGSCLVAGSGWRPANVGLETNQSKTQGKSLALAFIQILKKPESRLRFGLFFFRKEVKIS